MVEKNAYCGVLKLKKNQRRGSMQECANMGEVRYYGLKKIDSKLLEVARRDKDLEKKMDSMYAKAYKIKIKLKNAQRDLRNDERDNKAGKKNTKTVEKGKAKVDELIEQFGEAWKEYLKLEKQFKKQNASLGREVKRNHKRITVVRRGKSKSKSKKTN
jgi:hypothetical protein